MSAFPLGGYVKMAGETYDEDRQGVPDEFLSHPRWHRFLVAAAGPAMNIALAVVVVTFSYMGGVRVPHYVKEPAVVGPVQENSVARRAGLRSGDVVESVGGNPVQTWEDMELAVATVPRENLDFLVRRGGARVRIHLEPPPGPFDPLSLGFKFMIPRTVVAAVGSNSPAEEAGLRAGDEIVGVRTPTGREGHRYDEILNIISESGSIPLDFDVRRPAPEGSRTVRLTITPVEKGGNAVIGFYPEIPSEIEKYGMGRALVKSVERTIELSSLTFKIVGKILTGSASVKTVSGPIEIARMSGSAARTRDVRYFLGFIATLSLNLGIFNLLPIPILDGGVIALLLLETIMGHDLSLQIKEKIVQVGFVFLILLMGFVIFNDLSKIFNLETIFR